MAGDEKFYALHVNPAILETPVWRGSPEALHLLAAISLGALHRVLAVHAAAPAVP